MKRMLINAAQSEELRVAIVEAENQSLLDIIVDRQSYRTKTGNVYLGKVSSVEQSLDAAFINFGSDRHGFLPLKEISKEYFDKTNAEKQERATIKDLIKEGQYLMVQVEKEERGNKGAALTTFISLAGSYLVLMPNNPRAGGISRRVEGEDRDELREILSNLPLPENMGIIIRTAGVGKTAEELEWDLNNLLKQWEAIKQASVARDPPFLIHQESDIVTRIIRDYLRDDFIEILVDDVDLCDKVKKHLEQVRPSFVERVKQYNSKTPIFSHYQIEQKIESAYLREVRLPSGGSIVIDHTEALVAIDVNSARATKGSDIEDTALTTNVEAAEEIARQLRLRDIGGLIVIDFIDMSSMRNRREVENHLRNCLKLDKARTQIGNVSSRFGLLEMSRQRLRHSLGEATQVVCPRCSGWGTIRGIESLALSILRIVEEDAVKPNTVQIQVQLPVDVTTFIINEKRELVSQIEKNHEIEIFVIPNPNLESPHYHIKRLTQSELPRTGKGRTSYTFVEKTDTNTLYKKTELKHLEEKPAVENVIPEQPAPTKKAPSSIIKRLITSLFGSFEENTSEPAKNASLATKTEPYKSSGYKGKHPRHHYLKGRPSSAPTTNVRSKLPSTVMVNKEDKEDKEKKEEFIPVASVSVTPTTEPKKSDLKSRTRRGTRGGRRRTNQPSSYKKVHDPMSDVPETIAEQTPPPHLPPFPADLEQYYKQNLSVSKKAPLKIEEIPTKEAPVKIVVTDTETKLELSVQKPAVDKIIEHTQQPSSIQSVVISEQKPKELSVTEGSSDAENKKDSSQE